MTERPQGRWTTLLMDEATLDGLAALPARAVIGHGDDVADARPGPVELYRRWERQQWSAEAVELERDARSLASTALPPRLRTMLEGAITTFVIGEYTGLDMLGPIITGAPDEDYSVFLATQAADEARHTRLMFRIGAEVLGLDPEPRRMLAQCWATVAPAHRELSLLESRLCADVTRSPLDYGRWLQAVTLFHLITEGVLALVGQRVVVGALRSTSLFDGIKAGFTAMCRDESRHVGFGLHVLRTGLEEGHRDDVYEVLEQAVPLALRLDDEVPGDGGELSSTSQSILRRHLNLIGVEASFTEHLLAPFARTSS